MVSLKNPGAKTNSFILKKSKEREHAYSIQAISIDSLMKECNIFKIGLLEVDIEGVEKELFLKGNKFWINKVDLISIEFHNNEMAIKISSLLKSIDFSESEKGEKKLFQQLI